MKTKRQFAAVRWIAFAVPLLTAHLINAQNAAPSALSAKPQAFEVASVKLSPPDSGYTSFNNSGSPYFTARNISLGLMVSMAFGVPSNRISGPDWLEKQLYDVNAKAEGDEPLTPKQFQPLLQQMLEQRFDLVVHRETQDRPGYALVVAKGGPKLKQAERSEGAHDVLPNEIHFESGSMEVLAFLLTLATGRPVADRTEIRGNYELQLDYARIDETDSPYPSIFKALEEKMGLKLIPAKVPVELLVIDHADRIPTKD
jgi:uncharacterized protein (TIGR03435 family)